MKRIKTLDIVLIIAGISLIVFTITMINLFKIYGYVPDTLITCVFASLSGEFGICGWIKTTKDKNQQRTWQIEDEIRQKEYMKEMQKENDTI